MYRALEKKVLADEAERKEKERERRVSMGLPPEEGKFNPSSFAWARSGNLAVAGQPLGCGKMCVVIRGEHVC
jgi:hypothetical protein